MAQKMKDSGIAWIGIVPDCWKVYQLGQLAEQVKKRNEGLREQNLLSLSYGKVKRRDINSSDGLVPASYETYNIIEPGDVILRFTDLQNDQKSLRVGQADERGIITSAYTTIMPNADVSARFLFYVLAAFDFRKGFYGMGAGVRQGLKWQEAKYILIVLPPLDEQRRIADYLDSKCTDIDAAIEAAEDNFSEYQYLRTSLISEAVTTGLDRDVKMAPTTSRWMHELPIGWHLRKLKALSTYISDGVHKTPEYTVEGVPFLSIKDVSSCKIKFDDCKYISVEQHKTLSKSTPVEDGDVLFTRIGTLGKSVVVRNCPEFDIFVSLGIVKPKTDLIIPEYLSYVMQSGYYMEYIQHVKVDGKNAAAKFNLGDVRKSPIVLPPMAAQRSIVKYLDGLCDDIDKALSAKRSIIADLKSYKQSLIYEFVTGKREV